MKHIWNLFAKAGSLWVEWVHEALLKVKCFWNVNIPQQSTWGWCMMQQAPLSQSLSVLINGQWAWSPAWSVWSLFRLNLASLDWGNRTGLFGFHLLQENSTVLLQHGSNSDIKEMKFHGGSWSYGSLAETIPRHGFIGWLTLSNRLTTR